MTGRPWERFYHADDLVISYSYLYLHNLGEPNVNLQPTEKFIDDHLNKPHEWREGVEDGDQKILWWWCDALFMAPPVLTVYAQAQETMNRISIKCINTIWRLMTSCTTRKSIRLPEISGFYGIGK